MALEFRRRRFHKPPKKGQLLLALAVLILALCFATAWVVVNLAANAPSAHTPPDSSAEETIFTQDDLGHLLVIVREENKELFVCLTADPEHRTVWATGISADIDDGNGSTLSQILRKNGEVAVTKTVASIQKIPVKQYVSFNSEEITRWFEYLGNDFTIQLNEEVTYTDNNGKPVRLEAGEHLLNADKATALLLNNQQQTTSDYALFSAKVAASVINQYLHTQRYLSADFAHIADETKTSLRIGDFNDYRYALQFLAEENDGNVCKTK